MQLTEKFQRRDFLKNIEHENCLKVKASEVMEIANLWKTILNSFQKSYVQLNYLPGI